jgi:hypothetical protein
LKQIGLAVASYLASYKPPVAAHSWPAAPDWLLGDWISDVQQTKLGPLRFWFKFGRDRRFKVTGFSAGSMTAEVYRRAGTYEVRESQFFSAAINDGLPVKLEQQGDNLIFAIDEASWLELYRVPPR